MNFRELSLSLMGWREEQEMRLQESNRGGFLRLHSIFYAFISLPYLVHLCLCVYGRLSILMRRAVTHADMFTWLIMGTHAYHHNMPLSVGICRCISSHTCMCVCVWAFVCVYLHVCVCVCVLVNVCAGCIRFTMINSAPPQQATWGG